MPAKPPRSVPTPQELEILKVIWQRGQATVREVYVDLAQNRKIAYTTVLTMMGILEQKGHLRKSTGERPNVYRPAEPRERVLGKMVNEFIGRVFSGSAKPLLAHLVDDSALLPEELAEIQARLEDRLQRGQAGAPSPRNTRGRKTRGE